jgi:hypothetical protein
MARFNPQAFLAGMQSLMAPQQQADQQIAQMRMQQMDKSRENEALLNQRMLQGKQLQMQEAENTRASERFGLEREAAERQKKADERAGKAGDLALAQQRTGAAEALLKPVSTAKDKLLAARTLYTSAASRPQAYTRADYTKIVNDLVKAQGEYTNAYNTQKGLLKYVAPDLNIDETLFGTPETDIAPLTYNDAVKALRAGGVTGGATKGIQKTDTGVGAVDIEAPVPQEPESAKLQRMTPFDSRIPLASPIASGPVEPGSMARPVGPMPEVNLDPSTVDALSLLLPPSLGLGVNTPAGIGAVAPPKATVKGAKPAVKLGKDGKPLPAPYVPKPMPPRPVRQRVFPEPEEMILAADEEAEAQKIANDYATYVVNTFNLDPLDENFNERYYRYVADPERFKRFTSRYGRSLGIQFPEAASSILAAAESTVLGQLGNQADVPTALRAALTDVATKTAGLREARDEAAYKKTLRPLTINELKAKIEYYKNGGSKSGKTVDPFKGIGGRVSAVNQYGRSELIELDKLIQENEAAIKYTKKTRPNDWGKWLADPATETHKQDQIIQEARQIRAKIMTQQNQLRKLIPDAGQFYSAFISFDPVASVKNSVIASRLRAVVGPQAGDYIPYNNESPEVSPTAMPDDPTFLMPQ